MLANIYSLQGLTWNINQWCTLIFGNLLNICMESCVNVLHPFQKISQECSHLQHDQISLHCLSSLVSRNNARSPHSSCIVCWSISAKLCTISWDSSQPCCISLSTLRREMAALGNHIRHPQRILKEELQISMQLTINKTGITQEVDWYGCVAMYTQDYVLVHQ